VRERNASAEAALLAGTPPTWLFTLTLRDGRVIRAATAPISVPTYDAADGPYQYADTLAGVSDFDDELDPFSLDGRGQFTQARVVVTTTDDLAALASDFYAPFAGRAELALVWPGQAWEDRVVMLSAGIMQSVELGYTGEASTFSIESSVTAGQTIGDDARDVGVDFPSPLYDIVPEELSDLSGAKYQIIIGICDNVPGYKIGTDGAGNNRLLIAGHKFADTGAVSVYEDGVSLGLFAVTNATTTGGEPIAYLASATRFGAADGAYTFKSRLGGIAAADDANAPALYADGVLRYLLTATGLPVDWQACGPALRHLSGWKIGVWLDQEAGALDVIRDRLVPYLPIVEMHSGSGLWYAYSDPLFIVPEAELVAGVNLIGRVGRMESSDIAEVRNKFTINFDYDAFADTYAQTLTLDASNSTLCMVSRDALANIPAGDDGVRADDPIDSKETNDSATAMLILQARARRLAIPRRILTYLASPDLYTLPAGAGVWLTDDAWGLDRARGVIVKRRAGRQEFLVTIALIGGTAISRAS
jgi:hypothetical protein